MFRHTFGTLYTPDQVVFVDESSFDCRTEIQGRAWALSGKAAVRKDFFIRGQRCVFRIPVSQTANFCYRYSLLPALSLDGMISASILKGSFTTQTFLDFIHKTLRKMNPFPSKNSVLVMDNTRIHHHPSIVEMIEQRFVCNFLHLLILKSSSIADAISCIYLRIPLTSTPSNSPSPRSKPTCVATVTFLVQRRVWMTWTFTHSFMKLPFLLRPMTLPVGITIVGTFDRPLDHCSTRLPVFLYVPPSVSTFLSIMICVP
jgi:DDE superfamily endonuclease